jgi:ComEC/Rec2-related protein
LIERFFVRSRFPALMLLFPLVSGILLGPVAVWAWTIKAALFTPNPQVRNPREDIRKLIPILMAAAGLPFKPEAPSPAMVREAVVSLEGTLLDGPWPRIGFSDAWQMDLLLYGAKGRCVLSVFTLGRIPERLAAGDRIRMQGRCLHGSKGFLIQTRGPLIARSGQDPLFLPLRAVYLLRRSLSEGLRDSLERRTAALVEAMVLGLSGGVEPRVKETFRRTGTAHLLAISGLHMGLISAMAILVFKGLGLNERNRFWPLMMSLIFFSLLTGCRIPVLRAFCVVAFYLCAWRMHRTVDPFTPLFNACLLLVLINPGTLFDLSFQLSFAGYGAILLFLTCPIHHKKSPSSFDPGPETWWSYGITWLRKGWIFLGLSTASWLGTLPLTLYYFKLFNPLAPLINLAVFPFFVAALFLSLLHGALAGFGLQHSLVTAWPVEMVMSLLYKVLTISETLPPGPIATPEFPAFWVVLTYGAAITGFLWWKQRTFQGWAAPNSDI